jgi:hypothetical protein
MVVLVLVGMLFYIRRRMARTAQNESDRPDSCDA